MSHDTAMLRPIDKSHLQTPESTLVLEVELLVRALDGCLHPRRSRLVRNLGNCSDPAQLRLLYAEVFNLVALSFGLAEASRRLDRLQ